MEAKYAGGFRAFTMNIPNATIAADSEVVLVDVMRREHVKECVYQLKESGLIVDAEGQSSDFCVIDQLHVRASACDWLVVGRTALDGE